MHSGHLVIVVNTLYQMGLGELLAQIRSSGNRLVLPSVRTSAVRTNPTFEMLINMLVQVTNAVQEGQKG